MKRQSLFIMGGIFGAFLIGGGLYAGPYITLYQMYQSVKQHDLQGVAARVDFPALRTSVKANVQALTRKEMAQQQDSLMGMVGSLIGGFVLDPLIDQVVSPAGVAALLEGQKLQVGENGSSAQFTEKADSVDVQTRYESFNQFAVDVKPKGESTTPVTLLLSREGLAWKLSGVRLPGI